MAYLFSYQYISNAIIVSTLIHLVQFFAVQLVVFLMLIRTGSGLKMISHKLESGEIQYEGYDQNNKHLFTFSTQFGFGQQMHISGSSPTGDQNSDCSDDDEISVSNLDRTLTNAS